MMYESPRRLTITRAKVGLSFCIPVTDGKMKGVFEQGEAGSSESSLSKKITGLRFLRFFSSAVVSLEVMLPPVIMFESLWFFGDLERDRQTVVSALKASMLLLSSWISVTSLGGLLGNGSFSGLESSNLHDRGTRIFLICLRTPTIPLVSGSPFLDSRSLVERGHTKANMKYKNRGMER